MLCPFFPLMAWQHCILKKMPQQRETGRGYRWQTVPEPLSLVVQRPRVTAGGSLVQLSEQRLARFLAWVVGKLDSDWLGSTQRLLSIQALNGLLSLVSLVEAYEAHSS